MKGGPIHSAPENFLESLPIYTNENPKQGYGIFEGTINEVVNPVYKVDGNGVGVVYLVTGVHYKFDEDSREIVTDDTQGSGWAAQLKEQTGIDAELVLSGFQVESLSWRQIRFKWVPEE